MRSSESRKEVIKRPLIGDVNGAKMNAPLVTITAKEVVMPHSQIKKMPWRNARRIVIIVLSSRRWDANAG